MVGEDLMRNTLLGRIFFYLAVWAVLFLILCIVSVAKNWEIVMVAVSGILSTLIGYFLVIGLMLYGIAMIFRSIR